MRALWSDRQTCSHNVSQKVLLGISAPIKKQKKLSPLPSQQTSTPPGALPPPTPPPRITPPFPLFLIRTGPPGHLLGHLLPFPHPRTEKI